MQPLRIISSLSVTTAIFFAGCGGGGGSSPAASRISPVSGVAADLNTQTTADKVSADASVSAGDGFGLGNKGSSFAGIAGVQVNVSASERMNWSQMAQKLAQSTFRHASTQSKTIAAVSVTESCTNGGSMSVNASLQSNYSMNAGDTFDVTMRNCDMSSYSETLVMNGVMRMSVLSGNNISPYSLTASGIALGFEMLPLMVRASDGNSIVDATMDGGFKINFLSSSSFRLSVMTGHTGLTLAESRNGINARTTLSNFDFTVSNALSTTLYLTGRATVDTTRISDLGPTQYSWATPAGSRIEYNTGSESVTRGMLLLTSAGSDTRLQLTFGQSCASTSTCVLMEKATGSGAFTTVRTYTWADYSNSQ